MAQSVPLDYFNQVKDAANKFGMLHHAVMTSKTFSKAHLFITPITDTLDNAVTLLMCMDVLRCADMLGINVNGSSKESYGVQLLCYRLLTSAPLSHINSWDDLKKYSANLLPRIGQVLSLESKVSTPSQSLIIPTRLGDNDNDCKKDYLVKLYRWASIVAKADGILSTKEQQCLSSLLKSATDNDNSHNKQQAKQEEAPITAIDNKKEQSIDPYAELESLIGLKSVKEEVKTLSNFIRVQQIRSAKGMKTSPVSYHCIFTGNPGTGKTTIARILASIYKDLGIIKGGQLIETDRSGLVGEYIGSTAIKTNKVIDQAIDGVLFIDEAYALAEGGPNDFGKEAVATLLKRMEDERNRLVVILAGYPQNMTSFLNLNPGIQSRISRTIHFPDYTIEELYEIFLSWALKYEYTLSLDGVAKLHTVIYNEYERKNSNFGNARFVRNLFERTIEHQANRLAAQANIDSSTLAEITSADIY